MQQQTNTLPSRKGLMVSALIAISSCHHASKYHVSAAWSQVEGYEKDVQEKRQKVELKQW
jgi:hypothetical protein